MVNRILQGEVMVDLVQYQWDEMTFRRWEQDLKAEDRVLQRAARLEVQTRLLRLARGMTNGAGTTSMAVLTRADQIACYIARNYQQTLTRREIRKLKGTKK